MCVGSEESGTFRFCTDYRMLNSKTKSDSFPMPRIDDCMHRSHRGRQICEQTRLAERVLAGTLMERAKTLSAFVTPDGFYQYKVMPFGMKNPPATFQRLINTITSGLVGCELYLDDIVLYSGTWEDHLAQMRSLFDRLTDANLTVNLSKCEFAQAQVTFLGHVVGYDHLSCNRNKGQDRTSAVVEKIHFSYRPYKQRDINVAEGIGAKKSKI